ncbi:hypothetical protein GGU10DRAFT_357622 [Lentinula aff. detonsa]|uniref:Uncharacterized protein n=1 Tax=Lentinula aff. detonsa TaxID=2804958 RepID=A0AA38L512_9AGAR|nr:hypothetical protein GGU10DRAFT_357622 [Lentinula aff. detonsa]
MIVVVVYVVYVVVVVNEAEFVSLSLSDPGRPSPTLHNIYTGITRMSGRGMQLTRRDKMKSVIAGFMKKLGSDVELVDIEQVQRLYAYPVCPDLSPETTVAL